MQTYGPFYPEVKVNEDNGGSAWSIGQTYSSVIPFDNRTDFPKISKFGANVPSNKVIKKVKLELNPVPELNGFNISEAYIVGDFGEVEAVNDNPYIKVESDYAELSAEMVNHDNFGFKFSIYNMSSQTTFVLNSVKLFIDVE